MRIRLFFIITFFTTIICGQTKVGKVQFNDTDSFGKSELILNGAGQKDREYAVGLYLDFDMGGMNDGESIAEKDADMALTLKILSSKNQDELRQMVRIGLERATDGNSYVYENKIRDFLTLLPTEVSKHEIFKILYTRDKKLHVYKNIELLGTLNNSLDFKKVLFKIWLGVNPVDAQLKEDLLGSTGINPILGKWKMYDKDTGVAINIIQLYFIDKKIFGAINRMLRQSERDAICYKCEGNDKNQKVEGLVILKNLKSTGDNKYDEGKFTNINNGEISDCQVWIDEEEPDVLKMRYKGGGGTHKLTRVINNNEPSKKEENSTAKGF